MPVSIHIEPQFEALRRQMRRYPDRVVNTATIRTLNRLGAQARTQAVRTLSREYRVPQKVFRERVLINRATQTQHRVIVGFPMSRGSALQATAGQLLLTIPSLFRHLEDTALLKRAELLPGIDLPNRPFIQRPKGYRQVFARQGASRYPLTVPRVDISPSWRRLQSQLRAQASQRFPQEWSRHAQHLLKRLPR